MSGLLWRGFNVLASFSCYSCYLFVLFFFFFLLARVYSSYFIFFGGGGGGAGRKAGEERFAARRDSGLRWEKGR